MIDCRRRTTSSRTRSKVCLGSRCARSRDCPSVDSWSSHRVAVVAVATGGGGATGRNRPAVRGAFPLMLLLVSFHWNQPKFIHVVPRTFQGKRAAADPLLLQTRTQQLYVIGTHGLIPTRCCTCVSDNTRGPGAAAGGYCADLRRRCSGLTDLSTEVRQTSQPYISWFATHA